MQTHEYICINYEKNNHPAEWCSCADGCSNDTCVHENIVMRARDYVVGCYNNAYSDDDGRSNGLIL